MSHPLHLTAQFGPPLKGLIHVGANIGQEFDDYLAAQLSPVVYVEADPTVYQRLSAHVSGANGHIAFNALCAEQDGTPQVFHLASNDGNSSSMLDFGWHTREHPEVTWTGAIELTTRRLDGVIDQCRQAYPGEAWAAVDALVLDVQGAEMRVLHGATRIVSQVRCIWTEVNKGGLYQGDCSVDEVRAHLSAHGFTMKHIEMNRHGWGDALFMREQA